MAIDRFPLRCCTSAQQPYWYRPIEWLCSRPTHVQGSIPDSRHRPCLSASRRTTCLRSPRTNHAAPCNGQAVPWCICCRRRQSGEASTSAAVHQSADGLPVVSPHPAPALSSSTGRPSPQRPQRLVASLVPFVMHRSGLASAMRLREKSCQARPSTTCQLRRMIHRPSSFDHILEYASALIQSLHLLTLCPRLSQGSQPAAYAFRLRGAALGLPLLLQDSWAGQDSSMGRTGARSFATPPALSAKSSSSGAGIDALCDAAAAATCRNPFSPPFRSPFASNLIVATCHPRLHLSSLSPQLHLSAPAVAACGPAAVLHPYVGMVVIQARNALNADCRHRVSWF